MISTQSLLLLALTPLLARAQGGGPDLELDSDVSPACQSICRPVRQLSETCDVDDDFVRDRLTEEYLTLQCYCLNPSFDVAEITALCASCIQQNPELDDDDGRPETDDARDVNNIMLRCGFQSASYTPAQATLADAIVVQAVRPNNPAQLTTLITAGVGGGAQPTVLPGTPAGGGVGAVPTTGVQTTTFTTDFGLGPTTATSTIIATAGAAANGVTGGITSAGASLPVDGVVGWKAVLGYTVGVAAVAAWFF